MAPRWRKVKYAKITWTKLNFEDIFEEGVKSHLHALSCMTITLCINNGVKEFLKLQLKTFMRKLSTTGSPRLVRFQLVRSPVCGLQTALKGLIPRFSAVFQEILDFFFNSFKKNFNFFKHFKRFYLFLLLPIFFVCK